MAAKPDSDPSTECASADPSSAAPPNEVVSPASRVDFWLSIAAILFGIAAYAAEVKGFFVLTPVVAADLGGGAASPWLFEAFTAGAFACICFFGNVAQICGRRPALLAALLFLGVGTVLAAAAHDFPTMLVGRVLQGAGGAATLTIGDIVLGDMVPLNSRSAYYNLIVGVFSAFCIIFPLICGALGARWRIFFIILLPLIAVAVVFATIGLRRHRVPPTTWRERFRRIDWIGNAIVIGATTSLLVGLTEGSAANDWTSGRVVAFIVAAGVGFLAWAIFERYAVHPTLPIALFRRRTSVAASIAVIFSYAGAQGTYSFLVRYLFPLLFQLVYASTPLRAGIDILPNATGLQGAILAGNVFVHYTKRYKLLALVAQSLGIITLGLATLIERETTEAAWIPITMFMGVSQGLFVAAKYQLILQPLDASLSAPALTWIGFCQQAGSTLGQAAGAAVLQSRLFSLLPEALLRSLPADINLAYALPDRLSSLSDTDRIIVQNAAASAMHTLWLLMLGLCVISLLGVVCCDSGALSTTLDSEWGIQAEKPEVGKGA